MLGRVAVSPLPEDNRRHVAWPDSVSFDAASTIYGSVQQQQQQQQAVEDSNDNKARDDVFAVLSLFDTDGCSTASSTVDLSLIFDDGDDSSSFSSRTNTSRYGRAASDTTCTLKSAGKVRMRFDESHSHNSLSFSAFRWRC